VQYGPHKPKVVLRPDRSWVAECPRCRSDKTSAPPIGIGSAVRVRASAERLAENHRAAGSNDG
jgi:hypothetical protein